MCREEDCKKKTSTALNNSVMNCFMRREMRSAHLSDLSVFCCDALNVNENFHIPHSSIMHILYQNYHYLYYFGIYNYHIRSN